MPVTQPAGTGGLTANHLAASQTSLFPQLPFPHSPGTVAQTPPGGLLPPAIPPHPVLPLLAPASSSPLGMGSPSRGENQADILLKEISR